MKKKYLLITLFLAGFIFISCDDDDETFSGYVEKTEANLNANDASTDLCSTMGDAKT